MEGIQLSFIPMPNNICKNCIYFKTDKEFYSIDCLNRDISKDDYFKYLGDNEKGCPYHKSKQ